MALSLVGRLLVVASFMTVFACAAIAISIYLWVTRMTDSEDVQRLVYPALPGLDPGELPPVEYFVGQVVEGMYKGLPNPDPKILRYTIQTGRSNYPVLADGHVVYTTPTDKRTFVSTAQLMWGQKPVLPSPADYFLVMHRPPSTNLVLKPGSQIFHQMMDPGDQLIVWGNPGMEMMINLAECSITQWTPRSLIYQGNSPFTYTAPAGFQTILYTGPDSKMSRLTYSHNQTVVAPGDTIEVTRNGNTMVSDSLTAATTTWQPYTKELYFFTALNPGDTLNITWPAGFNGFMSVAVCFIDVEFP